MDSARRKLKILMVAAEVSPFVKVGGLADVLGGLPRALRAMGHDVRVVMPYYPLVANSGEWPLEEVVQPTAIPIRDGVVDCAGVYRATMPGTMTDGKDSVPVYMIRSDRWFADADCSEKVYSGDAEPYIFLNRAIMELAPKFTRGWTPDVLHCHDWQAGLALVYLKTLYRCAPAWENTAGVYSIHNLAHTGEFGFDVLEAAGLPNHLFAYDKLEFYGNVSLMKGGLVYADQVHTVSETYAREIQTAEHGCGFEGLFRYLAAQGRLRGIVNGLDHAAFNPATDPYLAANYSRENPGPKAECKAALQAECGFAVDPAIPVIGIVTRLVEQKGLDLIRNCADELLSLPIQLVVLGVGNPAYEGLFRTLARNHPDKVHARIAFHIRFAQHIYSGADLFLMPSRFEPCGLGQLIALRYGTIPVVRATGGLADTVEDFQPSARGLGRGNGFVFTEYNSSAMVGAVRRAVETFQDQRRWSALVTRAMKTEFAWQKPAKEYAAMYRAALSPIELGQAA
jgi:starch synthase